MEANFFANQASSLITNSPTVKEITFQHGYQPLTAGRIAPSFQVSLQQGLPAERSNAFTRNTHFFLQDFLDYGKPLVLFFSGSSSRAVLNLKKIEILQKNILSEGGKLLVLTPLVPKSLKVELKKKHSLSLFSDDNNKIAEAFGLYSRQNPLRQIVSGLREDEETLPAFYVISPDREIVYHYVDFLFSVYQTPKINSALFIKDLLNEVLRTSQRYERLKFLQLIS